MVVQSCETQLAARSSCQGLKFSEGLLASVERRKMRIPRKKKWRGGEKKKDLLRKCYPNIL